MTTKLEKSIKFGIKKSYESEKITKIRYYIKKVEEI